MTETPFFIETPHGRMFAVLHAPDAPARRGFVFCHPLAEEKLWSHRVYVSFARELARRGMAVLRFDERGHGDSEGSFEDSTLSTRLEDVRYALEALGQRVPGLERVGMLGLRFGALVAWLAARQHPQVRDLVLWEPVTDGAKYMQEQLLRNLSTQLATYGKVQVKREELIERLQQGQSVNSDGYEFGAGLFREVVEVNLLEQPAPDCQCLVVQVNPKADAAPRRDLAALVESCRHARLSQVEEQPFWREIKPYYGRAGNLFGDTLRWVEECV